MKFRLATSAVKQKLISCLALLAGGIAFYAVTVAAGGEQPAAEAKPLPPAASETIDFVKQVQPLLRTKCYSCHAGDEEEGGLRLDIKVRAMDGGDNGPIIVSGKSAESRLVHLIAESKAGERMPPADSGTLLTAEEVGLVRAWIDQGAPWPAEADVALSKKSNHWAFQPIQNPSPPAVKQVGWVRTGLDAFILQKLEAEGIAPAPEADKTTLLRRLHLDLVGLPPTPAEVELFLQDQRPEAYEEVVERLLASPHYGERWSRHWLDVARYADSDGYEKDTVRPYAYRWRDWVIRALNADLPFDQFTREQIAGDLLPAATNEQKVATGFHRNTLINREGGIDPEEDRVKRTVDRTNTVGTAWLGLTVGCAQCHNHKYDPITQREYYGLYAFFNSLTEPDIPAASPELVAKYEQEKKAFDAEHAKFLTAIQVYEQKNLAAVQAAWETAGPTDDSVWRLLVPKQVTSKRGSTLTVVEEGVVHASGKNPDSDIYTLLAEIDAAGVTAFRLEALPNKELANGGPGRSYRGNFVLDEFQVEVASRAQPDMFTPVKISRAIADFSQKDWAIENAIDGKRNNGWAIAPEFGQTHTAVFELKDDLGTADGVIVRITLDQNYESEAHNLGKFRLSSTRAPRPVKLTGMPEKIVQSLARPAAERTAEELAELAKYYRTIDAGLAKLQREEEAHAKLAPADPNAQIKAQAVEEMGSPRQTRLLVRGDFLNPGAPVDLGTPNVLPALTARGKQADRLDLANWLMGKDNPLTARVTVNRIWSLYFGRGIVPTVADFGTQGDPASHPELLDYLATQFRDGGWSLKKLHRLIVTSATYRQSSAHRPELADRDPYNTLLARQNRLRVEAEVVRDLALSCSGLLVPKIGGPSVRPQQPAGVAELGYAGSVKWQTSTGEDRFRRGLYTFFQRTVPYPMLATFDAPDSNVTCTRRERSNTPLQSLTLWNDPVFYECAQHLGRRIVTETKPAAGAAAMADLIDSRINQAFLICLARRPSGQESAVLRELYQKQLGLCQSDPAAAANLVGKDPLPAETSAPELATWIIIGRTLMNLDEFVTKE